MSEELSADAALWRIALTEAIATEQWWWREARHHEEETQRWLQRLTLAERRQADDLATEAARRTRHHAALARDAELHYVEQAARVRLLKRERRHDAAAIAAPAADTLDARFADLERATAPAMPARGARARVRQEGEGERWPTD